MSNITAQDNKANQLPAAIDVPLDIKSLIFIVRGQQVMLDSDLAALYQVETKVLNQAVKRNISRFPGKFCFQLTSDEFEVLKSQFVTSISNGEKSPIRGGRRTMPYVFNEQGIAMLSAVLRSDTAINVSIRIMETFVEMRRFIANNSLLLEHITNVELKLLEYGNKTDAKLDEIFEYINDHKEQKQKIFFDGQIYDAFSIIAGLVRKASASIILIDGYVDGSTLDLLSKKNPGVSVTVFTCEGARLTKAEISAFNAQYPPLTVKRTNLFHDRFLILDGSTAYHIGASIKDAGKKCFAINLIEDAGIIREILRRLP